MFKGELERVSGCGATRGVGGCLARKSSHKWWEGKQQKERNQMEARSAECIQDNLEWWHLCVGTLHSGNSLRDEHDRGGCIRI